MKHYPCFLLIILAFLFSCQKEQVHAPGHRDYMQTIQSALKDSLPASGYAQLDFSQPVLTVIDSKNCYLLRIPFKGKSITGDFMILKTDPAGRIEKIRIIHLEQNRQENDKKKGTINGWDGILIVRSLSGDLFSRSAVKNGFIKKEGKKRRNDESPLAYADPMQPEVLEVSSMAVPDVSWSTWISFISLFEGTAGGIGGSPSYNWYINTDPYASGGGGGGGGGNTGGGSSSGGDNPGTVVIDEPIQVDFETGFSEPAIDIEKYMQCFSNIPDEGATGSIEIFTDIPVDGDPSKIFNFQSGSPGHTFIQLRKSNGSQSVCQNIGFYPDRRWKVTLTDAPVKGKFVDNQHHEFNASVKIDLTSDQVKKAVTHILYLANFVQYDIDQYNCTDWALDVFNETVHPTQQLNIPLYYIPGAMTPSSTPQGLYIKLKEMLDAGGPAADNITIPLVGFTGSSDGPCN